MLLLRTGRRLARGGRCTQELRYRRVAVVVTAAGRSEVCFGSDTTAAHSTSWRSHPRQHFGLGADCGCCAADTGSRIRRAVDAGSDDWAERSGDSGWKAGRRSWSRGRRQWCIHGAGRAFPAVAANRGRRRRAGNVAATSRVDAAVLRFGAIRNQARRRGN